ncbi:MAG: LytTR family transcriptional regulator DNA-binding domain-containing protein [Arcicella sp.]|nr:LytTR family transcriptional regulator DNA-binding domain-containing protein [Arcicella sp.]
MKTYQQKGNNALLIINHRTSKKVILKNVVLLKGNINYTTIYMDNNTKKVIAHPIKFFEAHLETHGFLRVHQTFMVNPNHIKGYNQESRELIMSNGEQAIISRRKEHIGRKFIA